VFLVAVQLGGFDLGKKQRVVFLFFIFFIYALDQQFFLIFFLFFLYTHNFSFFPLFRLVTISSGIDLCYAMKMKKKI